VSARLSGFQLLTSNFKPGIRATGASRRLTGRRGDPGVFGARSFGRHRDLAPGTALAACG